jgi:hypothetical protein
VSLGTAGCAAEFVAVERVAPGRAE